MNPVILYRKSVISAEELSAAEKHFRCTDLRPEIKSGDLVIPRYSFYPFYADQEKDLNYVGAKVINTYSQHLYASDLINYVFDLGDLTPKTWFRLQDIPENGPFILKGQTNSRKNKWNTHMFARDKKEAIQVHSRLMDDALIGDQNICIRQFIPLMNYGVSIGGCPIAKEFRFFVGYGKILAGYYYWSNHIDQIGFTPDPLEVPAVFLEKIISIVGEKINFYVVDVAQTQTGEWIVIELNCGTSSGIPDESNADVLYKNLYEITKRVK